MNKKTNTGFTNLPWIDYTKGIGIVLVVIAHFVEGISTYILWFHMPLFFFVSGYLFKESDTITSFIKKKAMRLLIPYISFLILLSIPDYVLIIKQNSSSINDIIQNVLTFTMKQFFGGRELFGWFDVFWFITCLFFTQQVNMLLCIICQKNKILISGLTVGVFIAYSMLRAFVPVFQLPFFWAFNIVPVALLFYSIGNLFNKDRIINQYLFLFSTVLFLICMLLHMNGFIEHEFKMKWEFYGILGFNIPIALSGICITINVSYYCVRQKFFVSQFVAIGKAALIIMFLHKAIAQLIFDRISGIENGWIISIVSILICYGIYAIAELTQISRILFLGRNN